MKTEGMPVLTLAIKIILFILGIFTVVDSVVTTRLIIVILTAITLTALNQYKADKKFAVISTICYIFLCVSTSLGWIFLPVLFFDLGAHFKPVFTGFFPLVFILAVGDIDIDSQGLLQLVLLAFMALILSVMKKDIYGLPVLNRKIRDDNTEQKLVLNQKNQEFRVAHDGEIHLVTLKERNRLARDIHNHAGHSLSRASPDTKQGIGLQNIKERVSELEGYCRVEYRDGFRIFVTVPKQEK